MATLRMPIFGGSILPDTSGDVFPEPSSVKDVNDAYSRLVLIFNDPGTNRRAVRGAFRVPVNYVSSPRIKGRWWTSAITGQARWEFDYTAIANSETADASATPQESVAHTQTAPGTARLYAEFNMALTAANIAADDMVQFGLFRDGSQATPDDDTIAAAISIDLDSVVFEYSDV